MTRTINSYYGALLITLVGAGAALLIMQIVDNEATLSAFAGSEAYYAQSL